MEHTSYGRRPTLRNDELDPALTEVSRKVIGCAIEIHKTLGAGFDVPVYEGALSNELSEADVHHEIGHVFPVEYNGKEVGQFRAGLFVADRFIVTVLADECEVGGFERSALRSQLRAADLELGLIINFARRRLKDGGLVRVLNPDKLDELRGVHHDEHEDEYEEEEVGVEAAED